MHMHPRACAPAKVGGEPGTWSSPWHGVEPSRLLDALPHAGGQAQQAVGIVAGRYPRQVSDAVADSLRSQRSTWCLARDALWRRGAKPAASTPLRTTAVRVGAAWSARLGSGTAVVQRRSGI